jgi:hypothetical protein
MATPELLQYHAATSLKSAWDKARLLLTPSLCQDSQVKGQREVLHEPVPVILFDITKSAQEPTFSENQALPKPTLSGNEPTLTKNSARTSGQDHIQ